MSPLIFKNIARIAKRCPLNISSVVNVLELFLLFKKSLLLPSSFVNIEVFEFYQNLSWFLNQCRVSFSVVTIWVWSHFEFEFCHNLSFWVLSLLKFLTCVRIWVFQFCHNLSCHNLSFELPQFQFLSCFLLFKFLGFVTVWVDFWINVEFLSLVTFWVFELSQFEFLSFVTI